jgi:hypothetical protein
MILNILKKSTLCAQLIKSGSRKLFASNFKREFSTSLGGPCCNHRQETIRFIEDSIKRIGIFDEIDLVPAQLDWEFLLDEKNVACITANVKNRKSTGDIKTLVRILKKFSQSLFAKN